MRAPKEITRELPNHAVACPLVCFASTTHYSEVLGDSATRSDPPHAHTDRKHPAHSLGLPAARTDFQIVPRPIHRSAQPIKLRAGLSVYRVSGSLLNSNQHLPLLGRLLLRQKAHTQNHEQQQSRRANSVIAPDRVRQSYAPASNSSSTRIYSTLPQEAEIINENEMDNETSECRPVPGLERSQVLELRLPHGNCLSPRAIESSRLSTLRC